MEWAYLMFNSGAISHMGPHRVNVKMARALATAGDVSLRFDVSGLGDSTSANISGGFLDLSVEDIQHSMNYLEEHYGIKQFALIGICSGAVSAFEASMRDPRIVALLMFDGYWYQSRWSTLVRDWKRFRAVTWGEAAAALLRRLSQRIPKFQQKQATGIFGAKKAPFELSRGEFTKYMQTLVKRRVTILILYGGSVIEQYSYKNQFRDVFGKEDWFRGVSCDYCPHIDHEFVTLASQRAIIDIVLTWRRNVDLAVDKSPLGDIDDSPSRSGRPSHFVGPEIFVFSQRPVVVPAA